MQLGTWTADLRHAVRTLRRTPGFALAAIGMLGLAIGAVAGMFSVVDTVLLHRLPYADPDRLVYVTASVPGSAQQADLGTAPEFFVQYQEQSRLLEDLAAYDNYTATLRAGDRVERVRMSQPTSSLYSTLGVTPLLGRLPNAQDEDGAVVISHALWTAWFGRDPSVIGRSLDVAGKPRTVIGVMKPDFRFPRNDTMLWISGTIRAADVRTPGQFAGTNLVGRLAPGATPPAVADELTALAARLPERFGGTPAYARLIAQHRAAVEPLEDKLLGDYSGPLWILFAAACLVLLIACANVANLFLVRIEGRHQEMAVRRAIGAARGRLMRLHLAEAVVVAALAAGAAVALAAALLPVFLRMAPAGIPRLDEARFGVEALLFTALAAAVCVFVCGGLPALRGSAPDLARLREGGRGATRRRHWLRHGLVAAQTALALALLIGSGLLMRSAYELRRVDLGYDTQDILTFQIAPERPELGDALSFARFNLAFLDRLAALPGVEAVGLVENVPINESTSTMRVRTEQMGAADDGVLIHRNYAAGRYFEAMGIRRLAGRTFTAEDHGAARGNVIVSKSAAALLWPGRDPLGQRLQRPGQGTWETVVGVVDDVMQDGPRLPAEAAVYFPMADTTAQGGRPVSSPAYVIRSAQAEALVPQVRALVREVAPEAPMYRVFTMAYLVEDSMLQLSFTLLTLGAAALLALVLGAVGLYAVLSYVVDERTREIGVRMALGARAAQVRAMVVGQGARVVGAGVAVGILVALAGTHALRSLLYGVQPADAATFAAMALVMGWVGLLASYLPARRASNLDPVESLRRE